MKGMKEEKNGDAWGGERGYYYYDADMVICLET